MADNDNTENTAHRDTGTPSRKPLDRTKLGRTRQVRATPHPAPAVDGLDSTDIDPTVIDEVLAETAAADELAMGETVAHATETADEADMTPTAATETVTTETVAAETVATATRPTAAAPRVEVSFFDETPRRATAPVTVRARTGTAPVRTGTAGGSDTMTRSRRTIDTAGPGRPHGGPRPSPMRQLLIRVLIVLAAGFGTAYELTPWVATPLSLAAAVLSVEWLVRYRRRGLVDAAVVGTAGLVVALAGTGLVLNMLPAGLTATTWAIGATFIALDALFLGMRTDQPPSLWEQWRQTRTADQDGRLRSALMLNLSCAVIAVAVVAGAFVLATRSANDTVVYPVAISLSGEAPSVTLSVTTGGEPATYNLWVTGADGTTLAATQIEVSVDAPAEVPLTLPTTGRVLIDLTLVGSTTPVRELIVDNGQLSEETS